MQVNVDNIEKDQIRDWIRLENSREEVQDEYYDMMVLLLDGIFFPENVELLSDLVFFEPTLNLLLDRIKDVVDHASPP